MKFREINKGAKYNVVDSDGQVDGETLSHQDNEAHEVKVVNVESLDGVVSGQAVAGYDAKGDCYAAHVFPAETMMVLCEVEQ